MTDKTSSFLKVISGIVVFISLFLCITINPSMEQAKSTLSELYKYNSVPYLDSTNSTGMTTTKIKNNDNYKSIDTYYGTITAYGPDFVGCSGVTASGHNVYEYLNGKWNKLISELLDDDTQKIILTLFEPTSEENNYYLQISYQNNLDKNIKELRQITFKENNSLLFHQKNINNMKISKKLQNLVIYEWLENGDVCIYDLNNFSIDDSYNAKRAYLVLISRHN